ncbi:MAG: hypothetical protein WD139_03790 [Balneolaceae bacterium]
MQTTVGDFCHEFSGWIAADSVIPAEFLFIMIIKRGCQGVFKFQKGNKIKIKSGDSLNN